MIFDLYTLIGSMGSILVIVVYFATQQGWLTANDWRFPAANLLGAALIIVSLITAWNFAAFLMEVFWSLISIYGLVRSLRVKSS